MPTTREPQTKGIYGDCALGSLRERGGGGRYTNTGHLRFCYVTSFSFLDYACLACTLNATYSA